RWRFMLAPEVVAGPQHERRHTRRSRRRADTDAVADVGEPVVADGRSLCLRPPEVVLDRGRDVDEVVDALDVVRPAQAGLLELALEQRNWTLEGATHNVSEEVVLKRSGRYHASRLRRGIQAL